VYDSVGQFGELFPDGERRRRVFGGESFETHFVPVVPDIPGERFERRRRGHRHPHQRQVRGFWDNNRVRDKRGDRGDRDHAEEARLGHNMVPGGVDVVEHGTEAEIQEARPGGPGAAQHEQKRINPRNRDRQSRPARPRAAMVGRRLRHAPAEEIPRPGSRLRERPHRHHRLRGGGASGVVAAAPGSRRREAHLDADAASRGHHGRQRSR
jgi:hypothetical protein